MKCLIDASLNHINPARPLIRETDAFLAYIAAARARRRHEGLVPWSSLGWRRFTPEEQRRTRWIAARMAAVSGGFSALLIALIVRDMMTRGPALWHALALGAAAPFVGIAVWSIDVARNPRRHQYLGVLRLRRRAARNRLDDRSLE
ncbi:MAG: hypothetical protein D6692_08615 [Planctomycetota bacterium]|nr:MAG: hypothetical protein D6692_08615 [Planctomycetota bacterium]